MKKIALAVIAAGLLGSAAHANTETNSATQVNQREAVSLRVSADNVDFNNPAAVAAFRRQVERQIAEACNPGNRVGADMKPDFRCRREMAATLEPTVTYLAMRADQQRAFAGIE